MMKAKFVPPKIIRNLYPGIIWESCTDKILLTFDDSPSDKALPAILNSLEKFDLKAFFFVEGGRITGREELLKDIISAGHTVGNHSFSHQKMHRMDGRIVEEELRIVNEILQEIAGAEIKFFRPPFGRFNRRLLRTADEQNLRTVLWSLFTYDYDNNPAIVKFAIHKFLRNNSIVVLHDNDISTATTVGAITELFETAHEQNFEIGNPSECLNISS